MRRHLWQVSASWCATALVFQASATACAQGAADLPARDRPIQMALSEEISVGGIDAPPWAQFGAIAEVAFDSLGRLFVLDPTNHRVVIIDGDGRLIRTLGREGSGPGEFVVPRTMAVFEDGSVTVHDAIRRTFASFDPAGELRHDNRASLDHGSPGRIFPLPDGSIAATAQTFHVDGRLHVRTSSGMSPTSRGRVLQFSADGRRVTRIADVHIAPVPMAFQPTFLMAVARDGSIVFADSSTYAVHVMRNGRSVVLRRPLAPRAVTDQDRRDERARRLALIEGPGARATGASLNGTPDPRAALERERERIERMRFAPEVPVIAGIGVDWAGQIWVQRTGNRTGAAGPIDIITLAGEYVGTIGEGTSLPSAFGPGGRFAVVRTDDLGVYHILIGRVVFSGLRER
jgi:hypothetical protein